MCLLFFKSKDSVTIKNRIVKPDKFAFSPTLGRVHIGSRVRVISSAAFMGCRALSGVTFAEGLNEISDNAFANCASLSEIKLPESLCVLGKFAFKDCRGLSCVELPDNLEYLPEGAFQNCTSLKKIVLPACLKAIGDECFSGCTSLETVAFPDKLKIIGKKAFKRCKSLEEISLPESVEEIGDFAFKYCNNLQYARLVSVPRFLGKQPFMKRVCSNLSASEKAFVSSFTESGDEGLCPTISVHGNPRFLSLGFDGVLSDFGSDRQKTCFNHILVLAKQGIKVFVGENYYSYNNDSDYIIENGRFDYSKYDNQFYKATSYEKPLVAAYRLVYNESLDERFKTIYEASLHDDVKNVAVFATERNEAAVLSYLLENYIFDTDFYTAIYNIAMKNGHRNLLDIIPSVSKKTGISETEGLFGDLFSI